MNKSVVIITSNNTQKYGKGHFIRSLFLSKLLKESMNSLVVFNDSKQGNCNVSFLYLKDIIKSVNSFLNYFSSFSSILSYIKSQSNIKVIIFDKREIPFEWILAIKDLEKRIVIFDTKDNKSNDLIDYKINSIPTLNKYKTSANLTDTSFLVNRNIIENLQPLSLKLQISLEKLFSFKGSFVILLYLPIKFSSFYLFSIKKFIRKFSKENQFKGSLKLLVITDKQNHTLLEKQFLKLFNSTNLKIIEPLSSKEFSFVLKQSNLFLVHYGLSALEAIQYSIPIVFFPITSYHKALTRDNFPLLTYNKKQQTSYNYIVKSVKKYSKVIQIGNRQNDLKRILEQITTLKKSYQSCILCNHKNIKISFRGLWYNLYKCLNCLSFFMDDLNFKSIFQVENYDYEKDYFLEEYQKSYGKSYQDDEKNIKSLAKDRINIIQYFKKQGTILDIGAAFGYFLDVAKANGFQTHGIEISNFAGKYLQKNHQTFIGDFLQIINKLNTSYEIITMWYVIEHFKDIHLVLKTVSLLQQKGDIFAFSTPNGQGLSARFLQKQFLKTSPQDHYFIFTSKGLSIILKKYGYKLVKLNSTGIHYLRFKKRFPVIAFFTSKFLYKLIAKRLNLGDTMELFFQKE